MPMQRKEGNTYDKETDFMGSLFNYRVISLNSSFVLVEIFKENFLCNI